MKCQADIHNCSITIIQKLANIKHHILFTCILCTCILTCMYCTYIYLCSRFHIIPNNIEINTYNIILNIVHYVILCYFVILCVKYIRCMCIIGKREQANLVVQLEQLCHWHRSCTSEKTF